MDAHHDLVVRGTVRPDAPLPPGERFVRALEAWLLRQVGDLILSRARFPSPQGGWRLVVQLHPIDRGLHVAVSPLGRVEVKSLTYPLGPGFRVFLGRLLRQMGRALAVQWDQTPGANPTDATEEARAQLAEDARRAIDALSSASAEPLMLLPPSPRFEHDELVATPLGPRDMVWLASAAVGSLRLEDAFAWPVPGLGPQVSRGRALTLMWTEVRWRPPQDDYEQTIFATVDRLLAEAYTADATLDLPWAEWAEVQSLAGIQTELTEEVLRRCGTSTSWPPIGYRRRPVRNQLRHGWWVRLPGELAERWKADGTLIAWSPQRSVTLRTHGPDDQVSIPPGPPDLVSREPHRQGVAWTLPPAREGGAERFVAVMSDGRSTVHLDARHQPEDRAWVEHCWRSLEGDAPKPVGSTRLDVV